MEEEQSKRLYRPRKGEECLEMELGVPATRAEHTVRTGQQAHDRGLHCGDSNISNAERSNGPGRSQHRAAETQNLTRCGLKRLGTARPCLKSRDHVSPDRRMYRWSGPTYRGWWLGRGRKDRGKNEPKQQRTAHGRAS